MVNLPTFRQLEHLVLLAEHGHFGRAAAACHVKQSTLSASIKELENILQASLVDRTKRRVVLTPLGHEIVERARRILRDGEDLVEAARAESEPLSGTLRMGVVPTIGPFLLPDILPRLRRAYPALRLYLVEDLTARLVEELHAGRLDIVLLALLRLRERRGANPVPGPLQSSPAARSSARRRKDGRPRTTAAYGIAATQGRPLSARPGSRGMPFSGQERGRAGRSNQPPHPCADGRQRVRGNAAAAACHRRGNSQRDDARCPTHRRGTAEPDNRPHLAPRNPASARVRLAGIRARPARRGTSSGLNRFSHSIRKKLLIWPITAPPPILPSKTKGADDEPYQQRLHRDQELAASIDA